MARTHRPPSPPAPAIHPPAIPAQRREDGAGSEVSAAVISRTRLSLRSRPPLLQSCLLCQQYWDALWPAIVSWLAVEEVCLSLITCCRALYHRFASEPACYRLSHLRLHPRLIAALSTERIGGVPLSSLLCQVESICLPRSALRSVPSSELSRLLTQCLPSYASLHLLSSATPPLLLPSFPLTTQLEPSWARTLRSLSLTADEEGEQGMASWLSLLSPAAYPHLQSLQLRHFTVSEQLVRSFYDPAAFPSLTELELSQCAMAAEGVLPHGSDAIAALSPSPGQLGLLRLLALPTRPRHLQDHFFDGSSQFHAPATLAGHAASLQHLRLRALVGSVTLHWLVSALPSLTLLDLSGCEFTCCCWVAHLSELIAAPCTSSSASPAAPAATPLRHLRHLCIDKWQASDVSCCGLLVGTSSSRLTQAGEAAAAEAAAGRPEALLQQRATAVSAVNTGALSTLLECIGRHCASFQWHFTWSCQWEATVSAALQRLTVVQELTLSFAQFYGYETGGEEVEYVAPADEMVTRPLQLQPMTFTALHTLSLWDFPFTVVALSSLLMSAPSLLVLDLSVCVHVDTAAVLLLAGCLCPLLQVLSIARMDSVDLSLAAWSRAARRHARELQAAAAPMMPAFAHLQTFALRCFMQPHRLTLDEDGFEHMIRTVFRGAHALHSLSLMYPLSDTQVLCMRHIPSLRRLQFMSRRSGCLAETIYRADWGGESSYARPLRKSGAAEQARVDRTRQWWPRSVSLHQLFGAEFRLSSDIRGMDGRTAFFFDLMAALTARPDS